MSKKQALKDLTIKTIVNDQEKLIEKINKAIDSGCIDIDEWDPENYSMLIPKAIIRAVYLEGADQFSLSGTSFHKENEKQVKNILLFI